MAENEKDSLEHFFLTGNPNPHRIGCPPQEVLQSVARRKLEVPKEVFAHLAKCSECSVDVKAYRLRFERRRTRKNVLLAGGLIAAGVAGVFVLMVVPQVNPFHSRFAHIRVMHTQDVTINLWDQDMERGGNQTLKTIHVPPTSVRLIITLPRFSRPGTYQVSLCRERKDASAFVRSKADATSVGSREIVTVVLDLANVEKGSYWLSTRHNEDAASDYFPVNVL
jgi:hypothetical protein